MKIYSYRVDSVHQDMFKVLGGLSREPDNGQHLDDDGDEDDEDRPRQTKSRQYH